ncbi:MAG: histidine phosphatase family protein [Mycobacteriales bacterium]
MAELVLARHGQTEWSRTGRHTGRTDLPLDAKGESDAAALAGRLSHWDFALMLTSPLQRAARTAELAGLPAQAEPDLIEWDYGSEEGRTTAQAQQSRPGWSIWQGIGLGETLDEVAARQQRVLDRIRPVVEQGGDVCVVGHGHALRILAACWLGLPPVVGRQLVLAAGALSTLGYEHGCPALLSWNT